MFAIRSSHGVKDLLSLSSFRCLLQFSTSAASDQTHFMVDYLITSLGFSTEEAISASRKVCHLKSTQNCNLVLDLLKNYGLDKTQIRNFVSSVPQILLCRVDKTLEPKFSVLQDLGLSGSDIVKVFKNDSSLLQRGLDTYIIPTINYLRKIVGSDENVVKAMKRAEWLLSATYLKNVQQNVLFLHKYGLSNEKIAKVMIEKPRILTQKPESLEDIIHRVDGELCIPCDSAMFFYGVWALASVSWPKVQIKFGIFRSFGWSDSDIYTMARSQPLCLTKSEAKIRDGLNFFMKELGYMPAFLASRGSLLMYSLEKRVKPRNEVLKILREKRLVDVELYSLVVLSELNFIRNFVLCYKNEIPDLYETYTKSLQ